MDDSVGFHVGQSGTLRRTVTASDVERFAAVTGDTNPVHLDESYAARSRFGRRIAHGMLVGSYVSALLGTHFPGPGTIYLNQNLRFVRPVHLGDTLEVTATITAYNPERGIATLATAATNQRGETVIEGEATCLVRDVGGWGSGSGAAAS